MTRSKGAILCLLLSIPLAGKLFAQSQPVPQDLVGGQAASFVLGQRNFSDISFCTATLIEAETEDETTTFECVGPSNRSLDDDNREFVRKLVRDFGRKHVGSISGIAIADNKLIVADSSYLAPPNHNRILIYNDLNSLKARLPQAELPDADVVLGQLDFDTADPGTSAQLMNQPVGVATDGTRLFVSDWGNNRVLIYNQIPETNGAAADIVVGQQSFDTSGFGSASNELRRPNSVFSDGVRMMIADTLNNRVLIFNTIPTQNGASADVVLGSDSTEITSTDAATMSNPMSATTDGQRLIVSDLGNNRILIYDPIPETSGAPATWVVGQPDFTSNAAGSRKSSLNFPRYAYSDGSRLLVVDSGNNRILIYDQIPTANGVEADIVLGQEEIVLEGKKFTTIRESCAASNIAVPYSVASDREMLFVSDGFNRRVLGFRGFRPGLSPNETVPQVAPNGVVNTASFSTVPQTVACNVILPQPPVARGGVASIFGNNLADTSVATDSLPLPTELGGVKVRFNGMEAPLFYVSPEQINVQVPWELEGFSASMEIEKQTPTGTVVSAAAPVALANGAPGIYTRSGTGEGQAVIMHADMTPVTDAAPALPGETLTVYATGLGTVDHPVLTGTAAQFGASGSVSIGGIVGAGEAATITVNGMEHTYTAVEGDTLSDVVAKLADLINENDPNVTATVDTIDLKINLRARVFGDEGANLTYGASVPLGSSLTASVEAQNMVPGSVTIGGTSGVDQTVTITLSGTVFSYTTAEGDTLETIVTALTESISRDPNVFATADLSALTINLHLRNPDEELNIPYTAFVASATPLTVNTGTAIQVPGTITIGGAVEPDNIVNVILANTTVFTYTTVSGDTLETVVSKLAELINNDPNVSATANLANLTVDLQFRNPDDSLNILFQAFATGPGEITITAFTPRDHLAPGVANVNNTVSITLGDDTGTVPGGVVIGGTPGPGQTVTVTLSGTVYSYTTVEGDTLETIVTRLAERINADPNVSATADATNRRIVLAAKNDAGATVSFTAFVSEGATLTALLQSQSITSGTSALVAFAGLVKGMVGLYQVTFLVPESLEANPRTKLTLTQNLIIFGSVSQFNIISNTAVFPVAAPPAQ